MRREAAKSDSMSESVDIQAEEGFIRATYTGEFSVKTSKRTIDRILEACPGQGPCIVLLDCRKMTGKLPLLDRYQVAVYGDKMVGKVSRMALVRTQETAPPDRFTETVARNRGMNLKIFTNIDQAIEWLKS